MIPIPFVALGLRGKLRFRPGAGHSHGYIPTAKAPASYRGLCLVLRSTGVAMCVLLILGSLLVTLLGQKEEIIQHLAKDRFRVIEILNCLICGKGAVDWDDSARHLQREHPHLIQELLVTKPISEAETTKVLDTLAKSIRSQGRFDTLPFGHLPWRLVCPVQPYRKILENNFVLDGYVRMRSLHTQAYGRCSSARHWNSKQERRFRHFILVWWLIWLRVADDGRCALRATISRPL